MQLNIHVLGFSPPSLPLSLPPSLPLSSWMDGPMSHVDPDDVENDAGQFWRTLYKLEKGFQESPNPLKMAQKVRNESASQ